MTPIRLGKLGPTKATTAIASRIGGKVSRTSTDRIVSDFPDAAEVAADQPEHGPDYSGRGDG